jgi:hypothetical protein
MYEQPAAPEVRLAIAAVQVVLPAALHVTQRGTSGGEAECWQPYTRCSRLLHEYNL